jgi:hypothetical protein
MMPKAWDRGPVIAGDAWVIRTALPTLAELRAAKISVSAVYTP